MADFISAFKEGLEAAEQAKIARQEIREVFAELENQMMQGSEGKLKIYLAQRSREKIIKQAIPTALSGIFQNFDRFANPNNLEHYSAIVAENPTQPQSVKELAEWSQERAGYPCRIKYSNLNQSCSDRESLEMSLVELLRDPIVGEKLASLTMLGEGVQDNATD